RRDDRPALAGEPRRAADRDPRRLRRRRPRRDPRADRGNPVGDADGARARHPPRPGDAGTAERGGNPARLRGQRAGQHRQGAVTEEPSEGAAAEEAAAAPESASNEERAAAGDRSADTSSASEAKRRAKIERLRGEGIDP